MASGVYTGLTSLTSFGILMPSPFRYTVGLSCSAASGLSDVVTPSCRCAPSTPETNGPPAVTMTTPASRSRAGDGEGAGRRTPQDPFDARRQGRAADSGNERLWRAKIEATHLEDAFSVTVLVCSHLQYLFITRALALVHESRSEPPDQRVKPERGLDHHVDQGAHVVPPIDVTRFVGENGLELGVREPSRESGRP